VIVLAFIVSLKVTEGIVLISADVAFAAGKIERIVGAVASVGVSKSPVVSGSSFISYLVQLPIKSA
jgi:hypothetical protein